VSRRAGPEPESESLCCVCPETRVDSETHVRIPLCFSALAAAGLRPGYLLDAHRLTGEQLQGIFANSRFGNQSGVSATRAGTLSVTKYEGRNRENRRVFPARDNRIVRRQRTKDSRPDQQGKDNVSDQII
jgi:hypothetical protein